MNNEENENVLTAEEIENRRKVIGRDPQIQSIALAKHYFKCSEMAAEILELNQRRIQYHFSVEGFDPDFMSRSYERINFLREEIKQAHLSDLGVALDWK